MAATPLLAGALLSGTQPHVVQIVADDLGYDDLGHSSVMGNAGRSLSPQINALMDGGILRPLACAAGCSAAAEPRRRSHRLLHVQSVLADPRLAPLGAIPVGHGILCKLGLGGRWRRG